MHVCRRREPRRTGASCGASCGRASLAGRVHKARVLTEEWKAKHAAYTAAKALAAHRSGGGGGSGGGGSGGTAASGSGRAVVGGDGDTGVEVGSTCTGEEEGAMRTEAIEEAGLSG